MSYKSDLLAEAKERLTIYDAWQKLGLPGEPKRSCRSPFRQEKNASFSIFDGGKAWKDFATDEGGSVVDFIMKAHQCHLAEAIRITIEWAGLFSDASGTSCLPTPRQPAKSKPQTLSKETLRKHGHAAAAAVARLLSDRALVQRTADARGWNPSTVEGLALDGHLGWHGGKLAFIYDHGLKLRSKAADGSRVIRWAFGGNSELWRGILLKIEAYRGRAVWICEGETDAISLLDADMEDDERLIVALPCANAWHPDWLALFAGRNVVLALDADDAGEKATATITAKLSGVAASVFRINLSPLISQ